MYITMIMFVFMIRNQVGRGHLTTRIYLYIYTHGYVLCLYIMYIMYTP